tara:strand:+ start:508 stop:708 length:201 start_codon:yes stop_codon:yes gene_type:complete
MNWEGGADIWTQHDDLIEYFLSILNGEFDVERSRKEILEYNEEDTVTEEDLLNERVFWDNKASHKC